MGRDRAQLVLAVAAVIAAALAPALLAYLQLGYHADVDATGDFEDPAANARTVLDRATLVAVAFDVRVVRERGETAFTLVARPT